MVHPWPPECDSSSTKSLRSVYSSSMNNSLTIDVCWSMRFTQTLSNRGLLNNAFGQYFRTGWIFLSIFLLYFETQSTFDTVNRGHLESSNRGGVESRKAEIEMVQTNRQQRIIPLLIMLVGVLLMVLQIMLESEPGAIPLLISIGGGLLLLILQRRAQSNPK